MTKIYLFESVSLIFAAALLGTLIGLLVAITMTMQFLVFTELPFTFTFPWYMFLAVFLMCLGTATAASYYATEEIKAKSIANVLKGQI